MPVAAATRQVCAANASVRPGDIDFATLLLEQARASGLELKPENVPVSDGLAD
jgi:hypothetical protein